MTNQQSFSQSEPIRIRPYLNMFCILKCKNYVKRVTNAFRFTIKSHSNLAIDLIQIEHACVMTLACHYS